MWKKGRYLSLIWFDNIYLTYDFWHMYLISVTYFRHKAFGETLKIVNTIFILETQVNIAYKWETNSNLNVRRLKSFFFKKVVEFTILTFKKN